VSRLVEALSGARNFKIRVHAASLLARLKDPRALPALMAAAGSDPHPVVRGVALRLLARMTRGDTAASQQAEGAIRRADGDRDPMVRRQAAAALADLGKSLPAAPPARGFARPAPGGTTLVAVGYMGDRTGRASRAFRDQMRARILALLQREPRIKLAEMTTPGVAFLVDGTISRLQVGPNGIDMEALCAVELVVSRPPRGIVTIASGEAIVQHPRTQYRASLAERMQEEALENAVRSAHENLARFLAAQ
jgi:hypothetical protein